MLGEKEEIFKIEVGLWFCCLCSKGKGEFFILVIFLVLCFVRYSDGLFGIYVEGVKDGCYGD